MKSSSMRFFLGPRKNGKGSIGFGSPALLRVRAEPEAREGFLGEKALFAHKGLAKGVQSINAKIEIVKNKLEPLNCFSNIDEATLAIHIVIPQMIMAAKKPETKPK